MVRLRDMAMIGRQAMSVRRLLLVGAAALGLYTFGDDGISYLSTATRLASEEVGEKIPLQFELERAKTMIDSLVPDIKRNMIVIAKEEAIVDNVREELQTADAALDKQRKELLTLRREAEQDTQRIRIAGRPATEEEVKDELGRLLVRYKLSEATVDAKRDLLASRERSLDAARKKLESMLNARRDLEVQVEHLQARLRAVQSEAVTTNLEFDESQVAKCQHLVDDLRVRLQVAERLLATDGNVSEFTTTLAIGDEEDIFAQIDEQLADKSYRDGLAKDKQP